MEEQLILIGSLHLNNDVIPRVVIWIAGDVSGNPCLVLIVPDVPFVTPSDATFMSPDVGFPIHELVNVKLQRLSGCNVGRVKIDIVSKIMKSRDNRMILVRQALRRKIPNEMVIPQNIGESRFAAYIGLG